jgi:hypothetical protein
MQLFCRIEPFEQETYLKNIEDLPESLVSRIPSSPPSGGGDKGRKIGGKNVC